MYKLIQQWYKRRLDAKLINKNVDRSNFPD